MPDFEMWEQLLFIELYYGRNRLIFHELRCSETEVNIESSQGIKKSPKSIGSSKNFIPFC